MQEERGEGPNRIGEGLQKESSGETTPPSERIVTLKGESTESDLEEDDDEDEAIELRECDEEGAPYGQVRYCHIWVVCHYCVSTTKGLISVNSISVMKNEQLLHVSHTAKPVQSNLKHPCFRCT